MVADRLLIAWASGPADGASPAPRLFRLLISACDLGVLGGVAGGDRREVVEQLADVGRLAAEPLPAGLDDLGQLGGRDGPEDLAARPDQLLDLGLDARVDDGRPVGQGADRGPRGGRLQLDEVVAQHRGLLELGGDVGRDVGRARDRHLHPGRGAVQRDRVDMADRDVGHVDRRPADQLVDIGEIGVGGELGGRARAVTAAQSDGRDRSGQGDDQAAEPGGAGAGHDDAPARPLPAARTRPGLVVAVVARAVGDRTAGLGGHRREEMGGRGGERRRVDRVGRRLGAGPRRRLGPPSWWPSGTGSGAGTSSSRTPTTTPSETPNPEPRPRPDPDEDEPEPDDDPDEDEPVVGVDEERWTRRSTGCWSTRRRASSRPGSSESPCWNIDSGDGGGVGTPPFRPPSTVATLLRIGSKKPESGFPHEASVAISDGREARGVVGQDAAAHPGEAVPDEPGHVVPGHPGRHLVVEVEPVVGGVVGAAGRLEEEDGLSQPLVDVRDVAVDGPPGRRDGPDVLLERGQVGGEQVDQVGGGAGQLGDDSARAGCCGRPRRSPPCRSR